MRSIIEIIAAKRDGLELSAEEWKCIAEGAASGTTPDYQLAALLMASYIRSLTAKETAALVAAIRDSGELLHVDGRGKPRVDKHSTGGVGDKISLMCAPLAAASGLCVPMLAGRGLGWTGGTVDKLESLPGTSLEISPQRFQKILDRAGFCIGAQTAKIAPADLKLYSLRDVTATVDSIPLIVASIMGKKLATEADGLVLTVMWGSGAFMKTRAEAIKLGRALRQAGKANGRKVVVLLVNMDWPLGRMVGNWAEAMEVIRFFLEGSLDSRLWEVVRATTGAMLLAGGLVKTVEEGMGWFVEGEPEGNRTIGLHEELLSEAFHLWLEYLEMVGDFKMLKENMATCRWMVQGKITAKQDGYLHPRDCSKVGWALGELGGARKKMDDCLNPFVAVECLVAMGEKLTKGQPVFRILETAAESKLTPEQLARATELLENSFLVKEEEYTLPTIWEQLG